MTLAQRDAVINESSRALRTHPLSSCPAPRTHPLSSCPAPALTLSLHARLEALPEAAVLAVVSRHAVHHTVLALLAHVVEAFLDGTLEEAFTAFAAEHRVVVARALVVADHAQGRVGRKLDLDGSLKSRHSIV